MTIRTGVPDDLSAIESIDPVARPDAGRRDFLRRAVESGCLLVATSGDEVAGFVVLEHSFFGRGFIAALMVAPAHRRASIGSALVRGAEERCATDRIFVSTNASNRPMQQLLERAGYTRSGVIHDLDPGDPELVYSKSLRPERSS